MLTRPAVRTGVMVLALLCGALLCVAALPVSVLLFLTLALLYGQGAAAAIAWCAQMQARHHGRTMLKLGYAFSVVFGGFTLLIANGRL